MPRGRFALATAAGVGNFKDIGGGVGAAARLRYGLGGGHEVRAEASAIARINDDEPTPERPWLGKSGALLYKLSWKGELREGLALSAGLGGSSSETGGGAGADLALMAATRTAYFGGRVRPYGGIRVALAVPVGRDRDEAGGTTAAVIGAGGAAWDVSARSQLLVEFGLMHEWNRGYFVTDADPDRTIESQNHPGGYLSLGATFYFTPRRGRSSP